MIPAVSNSHPVIYTTVMLINSMKIITVILIMIFCLQIIQKAKEQRKQYGLLKYNNY